VLTVANKLAFVSNKRQLTMSPRHGFVICLLSIAALAQNIFPQQTPFLSLREDIQKNVETGSVTGLSIAIAQHGKILWQEGFGWANVERHEKATQDTRFYIASVTKTITATALMKLKERGKLRLDDPVNSYLGSAKIHSPMWDASAATIRLVASHRGGLTTFTRWCVPGDRHCDIDEEINNYGVLVWPPGEVFDYSNLGYGILGQVIENSSGQSLEEFLRKEVFSPLGMSHCGFEVRTLDVAAQYNEKTRLASPVMVSGHPAASGLCCSASDLLRFGMFHLKDLKDSPSLLSDSDIDAMHEAQPRTDGQYGLGWWTKKQAGHQIVSGEGGTADSFALVELLPWQDVAVVVIANSYSKFVNDLGDRLVTALIPGFAMRASAEVVRSTTSTHARETLNKVSLSTGILK
jgi:CubicO group peptidase (beta-lactamase class C family)